MIYAVFKKSLEKNPGAKAISTSKGFSYSYQEADLKIKQIAYSLSLHGIGKGSSLGVLLQDEDFHIFVYLALDILQATYVPFDQDTPLQQVHDAITTLNLTSILTDSSLVSRFNLENQNIIKQELLQDSGSLEFIDNNEVHISYIMSSSGSTGARKWIPILNTGISYYADMLSNQLASDFDRHVLCTCSPAYDARIFEYLTAFATQGCIYLVDAFKRKNLDSLVEVCQENAITNMLLIASRLESKRAEILLKKFKEANMRDIMVTGDACSPHLVSICEQLGINLWNCYGPTETTFGMSMLCVNDKMQDGIVPIGLPIAPIDMCIIDGEIFIISPHLSPGYLGIPPEINHTAFPLLSINGEITRVFRPGDKFQLLPNGLLSYGGRVNDESHIKVSGVKISAFDIEKNLNNFAPSVLYASVVIKHWLGKDKPVAYIVTRENIDKLAFIKYLQKNLKKEEIPLIYQLTQLPTLETSQKIDKKALINRKDKKEELFFNTEQTNLSVKKYQKEIANIWYNIFNIEIPPDLDFLHAGGDSQLTTELFIQIKETICVDFQYKDLLTLPSITIHAICDLLIDLNQKNRSTAKITAMTEKKHLQNLILVPPLLGEGPFTYQHLAPVLFDCLKYNVYALTDPGVYNKKYIPESLEDACKRYIKEIKTIQPSGPYHILGFSFGCTLAWKITEILENRGETVSKLYFLDGFPPYFYQRLNTESRIILLKDLINVLIKMLNNSYFDQKIDISIFSQTDELSRLSEEDICDFLLSKLNRENIHYNEARCMLLIAKRHIFLRSSEKQPLTRLQTVPLLCYTSFDQPNRVMPDFENNSADAKTTFWNHYFKKIDLSPVILPIQHLDILTFEKSSEVEKYFLDTPVKSIKNNHTATSLLTLKFGLFQSDLTHQKNENEKLNHKKAWY